MFESNLEKIPVMRTLTLNVQRTRLSTKNHMQLLGERCETANWAQGIITHIRPM